jgi:ankyrin repeat protein
VKTPLHYACSSGVLDLVKPLLKCCDNEGFVNAIDENGDTALHLSTRSGFIEIMKLLRKNKANPKMINLVSIHCYNRVHACRLSDLAVAYRRDY